MFRSVIIVLLAAVLGACTTQSSSPVATASLEAMASTTLPAGLAQPASDRQALVHLSPAAAPITHVHNNSFANGHNQTIRFGRSVPGLKFNEIDLRLRSVSDVASIEPLAIGPPTEAMIRNELAAQFPKMEMRIVDQPRHNAAGVYGLAVGRWENGARCIYAWQWIDNLKRTETLSLYDAAAIRIRFCDIGITLDQLAGLIDDLRFLPASIETKPPAVAAKSETIRPRRQKAAHSGAQSQYHTTIASRHRTRDAATLRQIPAVPTSDPPAAASVSALDRGLPAAAFRGPAADTKTANR